MASAPLACSVKGACQLQVLCHIRRQLLCLYVASTVAADKGTLSEQQLHDKRHVAVWLVTKLPSRVLPHAGRCSTLGSHGTLRMCHVLDACPWTSHTSCKASNVPAKFSRVPHTAGHALAYVDKSCCTCTLYVSLTPVSCCLAQA